MVQMMIMVLRTDNHDDRDEMSSLDPGLHIPQHDHLPLKRASLPIHSALGPPGPSLGSPWAFLGPALGSPWASPGLPLSLQCDTGNLSCVWLAGWLGGWLAAG